MRVIVTVTSCVLERERKKGRERELEFARGMQKQLMNLLGTSKNSL